MATILYVRPKLTRAAITMHAALRAKLARDLRSKSGFPYKAALKYVTQLALPRFEGTLHRDWSAKILAEGNRVVQLAGMVC